MFLWAIYQKLFKAMTNAYRPERHYMRGPGPKWLEKHRNQVR